MKTSYLGNLRRVLAAGLVPVATVRFPPDWYVGLIHMRLAPSKEAFRLNGDEFNRAFACQLAALDAQAVHDELLTLTGGKEPCLLCFEWQGSDCHRANVAEWLTLSLGIDVPEL